MHRVPGLLPRIAHGGSNYPFLKEPNVKSIESESTSGYLRRCQNFACSGHADYYSRDSVWKRDEFIAQ